MADAATNAATQAAPDPVAPDPAAPVSGAPNPVAPSPVTSFPAATAEPLHATKLSTLLESGKYSDLTLYCGSRKWKAHKSVLCIQSDFFAKACDGEFQEAQTNTIDLSEDHEHAVAALVHYLYHGSYDVTRILPESEQESQTMQLHIHVVGIAQKYFIEPLREYAKVRARDMMKEWRGEPTIFAEAVHEIYTGTMDTDAGTELRQRAVWTAIDKSSVLFSLDSTDEDQRTRQILIDETPGFMNDWATAVGLNTLIQRSEIAGATDSSDALKADLAKLNAQIEQLEKQKGILKAQGRIICTERDNLRTQLNGTPFKNTCRAKKTAWKQRSGAGVLSLPEL